MKAIWNEQTIAESNETIMIEGNYYFPLESVNKELLKDSDKRTTCHWKGEASYYDVVVDGETNSDAAWYYADPMDGSIERVGRDYTNYVAFWAGVEVTK